MDLQTFLEQLAALERHVDPETGAILLSNPSVMGTPDRVIEGRGFTVEFLGERLLCVDLFDPVE